MKIRFYLLLLLVPFSSDAVGAQLLLTNGDSLSGELLRSEQKQVVWKSPVLGTLKVPKKNVANIDGEPLPADSKQAVDPYDFDGRVSVGIEKDQGSSDKQEFEFDIKSSLKAGRYTHTLAAEVEAEKRNDSNREEDYELEYQAERSFSDEGAGWYLYGIAEWNKDRFRDPEQWTAVGGGIGYLWRPTAGTKLKTQLGVDRWEISRQLGNRQTTAGGRWVLDLNHKFQRLADIRFFHRLEALWGLGGGNNQIIKMTTGLRVPVTERISVAISVDHDRFDLEDNTISEDDETEWNLKLGFSW